MRISKPQFIEQNGEPRFAVVPIAEWKRIVEALDDVEDARAVARWKAAPGETIPAAIVDRLIDGENRIRVWREHRGLTQARLGKACGVSTPYISQLESGSRLASQPTLRKLASALKVDVDDLIPTSTR
jgi:DNA-binding XRE family transcriptional regulator